MQTSADIIAATRDDDLIDRLVALGAERGLAPQQVTAMRSQLAAAAATDTDDTVASVYAYKLANYERQLRPGEDPAAVTDDHLRYALGVIFPPDEPEPEP